MTNTEKTPPECCSKSGKPEMNSKGEFLCLTGILLLAALLVTLQRIMEPAMGRDSCYYLNLVEYWRTGGFQAILDHLTNFWFPPLHLFLITRLTFTGLTPESAAMAIGMGCCILMPLASYAIARELFHDRRISLAAALLTAVHPSILGMSIQAQRDVPYLLAAGWMIFFLIAGIKRQKWFWWCGGGACCAIAFLIRYETIEFLPLIGIYALIALWKKQIKWQHLLRNLSLFAATAAATAVLLLYITGTASYMFGSYYRYFLSQSGKVMKLYKGGAKK